MNAVNLYIDDISIHNLYRNALDIYCKHTALHLHVDARVS